MCGASSTGQFREPPPRTIRALAHSANRRQASPSMPSVQVADNAVQHLPAIPFKRRTTNFHVHTAAVLVPQLRLEPIAAVGQRRCEMMADVFELLGYVGHAQIQHLLALVAQHPAKGRVGIEETAALAAQADSFRSPLE